MQIKKLETDFFKATYKLKGFSLVETLVSILIISLLFTSVLSLLKRSTIHAKRELYREKCLTHVQSLLKQSTNLAELVQENIDYQNEFYPDKTHFTLLIDSEDIIFHYQTSFQGKLYTNAIYLPFQKE